MTLLLVWYALGWAAVGMTAVESQRLHLYDLFDGFFFGPIAYMFYPLFLVFSLPLKIDWDKVVWSKK